MHPGRLIIPRAYNQVVDEQRIQVCGYDRGTGLFTFERVFGEEASQETLFSEIAQPQLEVHRAKHCPFADSGCVYC